MPIYLNAEALEAVVYVCRLLACVALCWVGVAAIRRY